MRKVIPFGRTRVEPRVLAYKCAGGCGKKVEKPGNVCFACTMAELHGEPEDAA